MIKLKSKQQMSQSMVLAFFLTFAGGFQDAYSYNMRDEVFANAQTGNIVLLGQNLATGQFLTALRYLIPLIAFISGVYISQLIQQYLKNYNRFHWRQIVLIFEIIVLIITAFIPRTVTLNILANFLMSFACAMQVNSFRKFKEIPCATTMCIGNLRSATELLCKYHSTKNRQFLKKSLRYYFIVLIFGIGASCGAIVSFRLYEHAILIAAGFLLIAFLLMFIKEKNDN